MIPLTAYLAYLTLSIALVILVAQTLHRRGRVLVLDSFSGNEALADSVNELRRTGFYLISVGYVTVALSWGKKPDDIIAAAEYLSWKLGVVLLLLGVMHTISLWKITWMQRRAEAGRAV